MKVNKTSVFVGEETRGNRQEKINKGLSDKKTMDGSLLQPKYDAVEEKRKAARKKAMKIVGDAFANERKIDDDLNERRDKIGSMKQVIKDANRVIGEIEKRRDELREAYGVEKDSEEEADLKLLEKADKADRPWSEVRLTKEERKRAMEIREGGLTEYQEESLKLFEHETKPDKEAYEASREIKIESQIIRAVELERLKNHPMVDAKNQAEDVLEEASKEIVGMLIDETKEHVDEEAEKEKEKAKAEAEKEEALQEKLDAAREKKKQMKEFVEDILEGVQEISTVQQDVSSAQQEVKDMMSKMKMIEEEVKGAAVDETV